MRDALNFLGVRTVAGLVVMARSGSEALELEARCFPSNHARVVLLLARNWQLPEALCAALRHHHDPLALRGELPGLEPQSVRLIGCAALADYVDAGAEQLAKPAPEAAALLACAQFGLEPEDLDELLETVAT